MKKFFKYLIALIAIVSAVAVTSCKKDEPEPDNKTIPEKYVGTWQGVYTQYASSSNSYDMTLDISSNGTYTWVSKNRKDGSSNSGSSTCDIRYDGDLSLNNFPTYGSYGSSYEYARIVGGELWINHNCFTRKGGSSNNEEEETNPLVGEWSGSDGYDSFYIIFGKNGKYTDYLLQNGQKNFEAEGTYTISGSTITITTETNLSNCWGTKPYSYSLSNNNKTLTLQNASMKDFNQKLTLTRK